jgi:hypothetical protein
VLGTFVSSDPYAAPPTFGKDSNGTLPLVVNLAALRGRVDAKRTGSPSNLNRVSYVAGDPLTFSDPNGLCFTDPSTHKVRPCSPEAVLGWLVCARGWSMRC